MRALSSSWNVTLRKLGLKKSTHCSLRRNRAGFARSLRVESMEDRRMLAAVTVTNANDLENGDTFSISDLIEDDGGDGISIREAIVAANNTNGADRIDFATTVYGQTISLTLGELSIEDDLQLEGPASGLLTILRAGLNDSFRRVTASHKP